ncbi:hypothetical protein [Halocola ammonii]
MKVYRMLIAGVLIGTFMSSCEDDELFSEEEETEETVTVDVSPFIELNTLGGEVSSANAIGLSSSNEPLVVGQAHDEGSNWVGFVSIGGNSMESKGTLGGLTSEVMDTDNELHVGKATNAAGVNRPVYSAYDEPWNELHMDDNGGTAGEVVASNQSGVFIGKGTVDGTLGAPVMWAFGSEGFFNVLDPNNTLDLDLIDINSNNEVVAFSSSNDQGYLWTEQDGFQEIDAAGYDFLEPTGINNNSKISCTVYSGSDSYPAVYDISSESVTLLTLPSGFDGGSTNAINNNDEVVGVAGSFVQVTPVYWDASGNPTNLNDVLNVSEADHDALGYNTYVLTAVDINDNGDITGDGYFNLNVPDDSPFPDRQREAYLLLDGTY